MLGAQDIIIKNNGDEIEAKVTEITPELVKYYKFSRPDGPIYSIYIKDIFMIKYPDGDTDVFGKTSETNHQTVEEVKNYEQIVLIDTIIDQRDRKKYKIIKIGDQWWMKENLFFQTKDSRCYDNKSDYCRKCGFYYPYKDAIEACPDGWHLPSDSEWIVLETELGMSDELAKANGWRGSDQGQAPKLLLGGSSGFDLIFCGVMVNSIGGIYYNSYHIHKEGFYWTATEKNISDAWGRHFKNRASIDRRGYDKIDRLSVRCIKDSE